MDLVDALARYGPDAGQIPPTLAEAEAYCRHLACRHYENFTVVSRLVPRHLVQPLCNLYAYCRWADDLADETLDLFPRPAATSMGRQADLAASRSTSLALLDWWEAQLQALYRGEEPTHPVFVALARTVRQFHVPQEPLADLLVAMRRDQVQHRYQTWEELLSYCEKSANPVGRLVLHLAGHVDCQQEQWSDGLCTGLQLANFCQDVRRDWERGRIYLPQEACLRHGWDEARFAAGRCDDAFRRLLSEMVQRAEAHLEAGRPLADHVAKELRLSVRLFYAGGKAILAAIRRRRYDVWSCRPTLGWMHKGWLLARTLLFWMRSAA
jgi:squalene synthase HpnC